MGPISTLKDLWAALWRKAWFIVLVMAVGLPLVVAFVLSRPKVFEATSVIQIQIPDIAVSAAGQVQGQSADAQINMITQNMMARANIEAQLARFELFADLPTQTERVAALRQSIITTKLMDPANAWRPDAQPSGIALTVRLDDPFKAAGLANALTDAIVTEARDRTAGRANRTLDFLVREEARVAAAITTVENQIAQYRATHLQSLPEGLTSQRDRLSRLSETRLDLEQQLIQLQSSRERLRADDSAQQEARLTEQLALVASDMAEINAAVAAAPDVERDLSALQRQLSQYEAEFNVLTTQRTEAATAQLLATQEDADRFVILEEAAVPENPVSSSRRKLALAGGLSIVMAAFGGALALEILNPVIRTPAQLERAFGVQPAIIIPLLHPQKRKLTHRLMWGLIILVIVAALCGVLVLLL